MQVMFQCYVLFEESARARNFHERINTLDYLLGDMWTAHKY